MMQKYIIAALAGMNIGGALSSLAGDSAVRAIVIGIATALGNVLATHLYAWQRSRLKPATAASLEQDEAAILAAVKPLIEQWGHEKIARAITRSALATPTPAPVVPVNP